MEMECIIKPEKDEFVNLRKKSNFSDDWPYFGPEGSLFGPFEL